MVVPHFFHGQRTGCRKLIVRYGHRQAMAAFPELEGAKVVEVPVDIVQRVDHNRYSAEVQRKLRHERGVGSKARIEQAANVQAV